MYDQTTILSIPSKIKQQVPEENYTAKGRFHDEVQEPGIIVSSFKKGVWVEDKVCTAPMIADEIEKYDDRSLLLMMHELTKSYSIESKALNLTKKFADELIDRQKKREEHFKKIQAEITPQENNSWMENFKKQEIAYLGKSLVTTQPGVSLFGKQL